MSRRKAEVVDTAMVAPITTAEELYAQVRGVLQQARQQSWRQVNHTMVRAYWQVGRLIVEHEQAEQARAAYARACCRRWPGTWAPNSAPAFRQPTCAISDSSSRPSRWTRFATRHVVN